MKRRQFIRYTVKAGIATPFLSVPVFTSRKTSVGIIGLGSRGKQLVSLLSQFPNASVDYLCDLSADTLAGMGSDVATRTLPPPECSTDYRDLLSRNCLDLIIVASSSPTLTSIATQACRSGKFVYIETPAFSDSHMLTELDELVRQGNHSQVGWQRRSAPSLVEACRHVGNGDVGVVEQLTITHTYDPAITSIRRLHEMALQDLDLGGFLSGINSVADKAVPLIRQAVPDFGSSGIAFAIGSTRVNWQSMARIGHEPTLPTRTIRLFGSRGYVETEPSGLGYRLLDLNGIVLRQVAAENSSDAELTALHLANFLTRIPA